MRLPPQDMAPRETPACRVQCALSRGCSSRNGPWLARRGLVPSFSPLHTAGLYLVRVPQGTENRPGVGTAGTLAGTVLSPGQGSHTWPVL